MSALYVNSGMAFRQICEAHPFEEFPLIHLNCHNRPMYLTKSTQGSPQYTYSQLQQNPGTTQYTGYPPTSQYGAYPSTAQTQTYAGSSTLPTSLHTGPAENITDGDLYQRGARARGLIKGTQGDVEELDSGKLKPVSSCVTLAQYVSFLHP
jgi:hypothetical protein